MEATGASERDNRPGQEAQDEAPSGATSPLIYNADGTLYDEAKARREREIRAYQRAEERARETRRFGYWFLAVIVVWSALSLKYCDPEPRIGDDCPPSHPMESTC